jgi:hypothetical protein
LALPAARSIAQICCRVVIASKPSSSPPKIAELGKVHVNRTPEATLLADRCG